MLRIIEKIRYYDEVKEQLRITEDDLFRAVKAKTKAEKQIEELDNELVKKNDKIQELKQEIKNNESELKGAKAVIRELTKEKDVLAKEIEELKQEKREISASLGGTKTSNKNQKKKVKQLEDIVRTLKKENRLLKCEVIKDNKLRDPHAVRNYEENFVRTRKQRKNVTKEIIKKRAE